MENEQPKVDLVNKTIKPKKTKPKTVKTPADEVFLKGEVKPRSKFFLIAKIIIVLLAILVIIGVTYAYRVIASAGNNIIEGEDVSFLQQLSMLATSSDKPLKGEENDLINFMLLGMGGVGHSSGNYLADTIIVASYKPSTEEIAMLSVPRDLLVDIPGYYYRKINNSYAFSGAETTKEILQEVTGLDIHYWMTIDFEGFKSIIDTLDGVEVCVDNEFTDYKYPDYNYGYQTVHFEEGCQNMEGETALQYSRSRKGNNNEGSDFARSERQQKVIAATKEKALTAGTLLNPNKSTEILNSLGDHVTTNMELWEMLSLAKKIKNIDPEEITTRVIDNSAQGVLHSEILDNGAYVLIPNAGLGNYSDIQLITQNLFEYVEVIQEYAEIEVQNGTEINGLAYRTQQSLESNGFEVVKIGNATIEDSSLTVIYDLTDGKMPKTLAKLQENLNVKIETYVPLFLLTDDTTINDSNINTADLQYQLQDSLSKQVDFLIVIGQDLDDTPITSN